MRTKKRLGWLWIILALALSGCTSVAASSTIAPDAEVLGQANPDSGPFAAGGPIEKDANRPRLLTGEDLAALALIQSLHEAHAEHIEQSHLLALIQAGDYDHAFEEAFEFGDELFETSFNTTDGVGANVGNGQRFTQVPRADLAAAGQWANHTPKRITGPNAEACNNCHGQPFDDGAGRAASNNARDPFHTGDLKQFIQRQTPHVFGAGAVQVLAEEMTEELHGLRYQALIDVCTTRQEITVELIAKGVDFGTITLTPATTDPCVAEVDASNVVGINQDLIVRPFQWKGVNASIREFNRDAAHQELGMQSVEIVGENVDGDFDGVVNELTVGDQTALAIYVAAQPRPTTRLELAALGLIEPLSENATAAIRAGEQAFANVGCTTCHVAQMTINDPVFYEPSRNPNYRDERFPAGLDPLALGVDPDQAVRFDLTTDHPDNLIELANGEVHRLGSLFTNGSGGATIALYGDLKRHDMGSTLAEPIDDEGVPSSVFLTENLWGVGSTWPYLHDGRAATLAEAILSHGGEAATSREAFTELDPNAQTNLITFLENLVLYKIPEE